MIRNRLQIKSIISSFDYPIILEENHVKIEEFLS